MFDQPLLSLLIPTVPRHLELFQPLWASMMTQTVGRRDVEVFVLLDNRALSIGAKRGVLLNLARGRHFAFIDSDDRVADDFVNVVLANVSDDTDLLIYRTIAEIPGAPDCVCDYEVGSARIHSGNPWTRYVGPPAHHHVWRTDLVRDISFPDQNVGEDFAWAAQAQMRVKNVVKTDRVLYFYRYDMATSESAKVD